jgi:transcriptional regulator with XRE-family HTH domain
MRNFLFAERLKALRGDLSKAEFARKIGVSSPVYQRYEEGRIPRANTLSVIAERCGIRIEDLLCDNPGLAAHASGFTSPATLREPAPTYSTLSAKPAQPVCRYPADCDLSNRLAKMETQLDTLTRLLGATLAANANGVAHDKQKAG